MKFLKLDHIGVVVNDMAAAKAFFLDFGLELLGESEMEGKWLDKLVGLEGVRSGIAVFRAPNGDANLELIKYYSPEDENGIRPNYPNNYGIRNICFEVDDVEAIFARLKEKGMPQLGEIQQYEDEYKLCYCRGPEGIILMVAQKLK
ncbi:MAG: VOC family protein [Chloroflexi bacterium]|nr:VOC family protein [Chloroflexota bacterium]OJV99190.1 MAG: glyoxalase [Chloroflexi bacterium 54-19]